MRSMNVAVSHHGHASKNSCEEDASKNSCEEGLLPHADEDAQGCVSARKERVRANASERVTVCLCLCLCLCLSVSAHVCPCGICGFGWLQARIEM